MMPESSSYHRHRFPAEIIRHAVWLYHVFSLSLRDVELILAERGVLVTHESIRHHLRELPATASSLQRGGLSAALGPKRFGLGDRRRLPNRCDKAQNAHAASLNSFRKR